MSGKYIRSMMRTALLVMLCVCSVAAVSGPKPQRVYDDKAEQWADSVMAVLSPRQRVAQLFVPRLDIVDNAAGFATLRRMIVEQGVGGILLGKGSAKSYATINNMAQSEADVPVLVTLDGEWGPAMRVTDVPRFPHNMALGAISDTRLIYEYGREVARQCRVLGVHVDFAPVLDVNSNPLNPVIGYRSFGEDPLRVAALGAAYCAGMESGGVMSVGKHFPGHGDTSTDSHKAVTTVDHDAATLHSVDLLPFRAAIDAGMTGIMVGHLRVPSLDKSGAPASLSKRITTDLLQHDMGFDGLIFTDALAMKGAVTSGENNCVSALKAGADILLGSAAPVHDIEAVVKAVKSGKIKQADIDRRCRKLLVCKYRLGLYRRAVADVAEVKKQLNSPQAYNLIDRLAKAAVTVLRNDDGLLPVNRLASRTVAVVSVGAPAENEFSAYCARYAQVSEIGLEKGSFSSVDIKKIEDADVVIAGVFSDAVWAQKAFNELKNRHNFAAVFFMNPYKMAKFGRLDLLPTLVAAYDDVPALRRAGAEALFGGIDVSGRFPVNVDNVAPLGTGIDMKKSRLGYASLDDVGLNQSLADSIDSIVASCIRAKAFPGCQVMLVKNGSVVFDGNYGTLDYSSESPGVTSETLYDVASMTKATATVAGLMKVYDEGLLDLDSSIARYIPECENTDKENVTVRQLLTHESGLPATFNIYDVILDSASYDRPLFRYKRVEPYTVRIDADVYANRNARLRSDMFSTMRSDDFDAEIADGIFGRYDLCDSVMNGIYNQPLGKRKYLYSCLNFCLLMNIEENLTGVAHDQWVQTEVFAPIGAWRAGYRPLTYYPVEKIAPTERDGFLRKHVLQGVVHDELAAFSGGVQGNAGLFSNAADIAKLCQTWLNGGSYGGERIFDAATVGLFTSTKSDTCERGLGFDRLSGLKSMAGIGAPTSVYGHTGFTGTCFWIDPDNDMIFIFLSNRVHPSRVNVVFNKLNPRRSILAQIYIAMK